MASTITYINCPGCNNGSIQKVLTAKDYTVSNELFEIWECGNCTLRFTQHVPNQEASGPYYRSNAYVSHSDSKEGFINKLYHWVRNYTLNIKKKFVIKNTGIAQGNLLDVGAGTGAFSNAMQQAGWSITGLEPDDVARTNAYNKYQLSFQSPNQLYSLQANQFDAVTLWHVLEHVHDLHGYLQQFHKVLKTGGKLFIAVPNYTSKDAQWYKELWAAYDVPRHLYHFSPRSMELLAGSENFVVENIEPMWFDSYYVAMLSEQYKNGNANFLGLSKAAFNGFFSNLPVYLDSKKCSSVIYVLRKK